MKKILHGNKQFRKKILFRICCLLMSLTFMPDTVWSFCNTDHLCEQPFQENLPENGEKEPCGDSSSECAEDPGDSFLHPGHMFQQASYHISQKMLDLESHDLRDQVKEIISPPPKHS